MKNWACSILNRELDTLNLPKDYTEIIIDKIDLYIIRSESKTAITDFEIAFRKLIDNLNPKFFESLINKEINELEGISINDLFKKTDMQLNPELFKSELNEIEIRSNIKLSFETVYRICKICLHDRAYFSIIIVSAGDESEATLYICEKCGNRHRTSTKE